MLKVWSGHARLDAGRVGVGFSLGGFTALVEVGGVPELRRMRTLCSERPDAPECLFIKQRGGDQLEPDVSMGARRPRSRASRSPADATTGSPAPRSPRLPASSRRAGTSGPASVFCRMP